MALPILVSFNDIPAVGILFILYRSLVMTMGPPMATIGRARRIKADCWKAILPAWTDFSGILVPSWASWMDIP